MYVGLKGRQLYIFVDRSIDSPINCVTEDEFHWITTAATNTTRYYQHEFYRSAINNMRVCRYCYFYTIDTTATTTASATAATTSATAATTTLYCHHTTTTTTTISTITTTISTAAIPITLNTRYNFHQDNVRPLRHWWGGSVQVRQVKRSRIRNMIEAESNEEKVSTQERGVIICCMPQLVVDR